MTKTPRCPLTYRGPEPLVNGSCAMTKIPFLGLRDTRVRAFHIGTLEAILPASRCPPARSRRARDRDGKAV